MRLVFLNPKIRLSEMVCYNPESTEDLVFPTLEMIDEWLGVLHTLTGLENSKDGRGSMFNFISSNGARTQQRDKIPKYTTHMIPGTRQIRSVEVYYIDGTWIHGFGFFD